MSTTDWAITPTPCDGCGRILEVGNGIGVTSARLPGGTRRQVCCNGGICWALAEAKPEQLGLFA